MLILKCYVYYLICIFLLRFLGVLKRWGRTRRHYGPSFSVIEWTFSKRNTLNKRANFVVLRRLMHTGFPFIPSQPRCCCTLWKHHFFRQQRRELFSIDNVLLQCLTVTRTQTHMYTHTQSWGDFSLLSLDAHDHTSCPFHTCRHSYPTHTYNKKNLW